MNDFLQHGWENYDEEAFTIYIRGALLITPIEQRVDLYGAMIESALTRFKHDPLVLRCIKAALRELNNEAC